MIKKLMSLVCIFYFCSLSAWNDAGHMTVAEITRRHLHPEALVEVEKIIKVFENHYPEQSTFQTAATWPDQLSRNGLKVFDSWHYIMIPYDPESILSDAKLNQIKTANANSNVVWGIEQAIQTLKNPLTNDFEKAFMIRFLLHLVADVHQPMHNTTLFSHQFPDGDYGGNGYRLLGDYKNLHKYWDFGGGLLSDHQSVDELADRIIDEVSLEGIHDQISTSAASWSAESYSIAVSSAYKVPEGSYPSEEYQQSVQQISKERLAIAGYRLAYLLNHIFPPSQS